MESPTLSIIIVNWNTRELLLKCIRSIIDDCRGITTEIIISDNASTDGSADAVRRDFPDIKVINNSVNLGFAGGNNVGIKESRGAYICLVNSDVEIISGCFSGLLRYMKSNPLVGIAGPKAVYPDKQVQITARKEVGWLNSILQMLWFDKLFPSLTRYSQNIIEEVDILSGCFWMIKREALVEIGLLDENFFFYGEDRDYCKRMWLAGWKVIYNPEYLIIHHEGGSSKARPLQYYIQLEKAYIGFWKKYHSWLSNIFYYYFRVVYHTIRFTLTIAINICDVMNKRRNKEKALRHWSCIRMLLVDIKPLSSPLPIKSVVKESES